MFDSRSSTRARCSRSSRRASSARRTRSRRTTTTDRKSTRLNSSHTVISYAVFCLKKKKKSRQLRNTMENEIQAQKDAAEDEGRIQQSTLVPMTENGTSRKQAKRITATV